MHTVPSPTRWCSRETLTHEAIISLGLMVIEYQAILASGYHEHRSSWTLKLHNPSSVKKNQTSNHNLRLPDLFCKDQGPSCSWYFHSLGFGASSSVCLCTLLTDRDRGRLGKHSHQRRNTTTLWFALMSRPQFSGRGILFHWILMQISHIGDSKGRGLSILRKGAFLSR